MREHHGSSLSAENEWLFRHEKDDAWVIFCYSDSHEVTRHDCEG